MLGAFTVPVQCPSMATQGCGHGTQTDFTGRAQLMWHGFALWRSHGLTVWDCYALSSVVGAKGSAEGSAAVVEAFAGCGRVEVGFQHQDGRLYRPV